jgi:hypothetical protein
MTRYTVLIIIAIIIVLCLIFWQDPMAYGKTVSVTATVKPTPYLSCIEACQDLKQ